MERLGIALRGEVVKNLFLRDDKGRRHFLVLLPHDKAADLAALRTLLSSSKLSFASPERLMKHLGLTPGSVTVLGLLHEGAAPVEVLVDEELMTRPLLGVHPCDNTATLWITCLLYTSSVRRCSRRACASSWTTATPPPAGSLPSTR